MTAEVENGPPGGLEGISEGFPDQPPHSQLSNSKVQKGMERSGLENQLFDARLKLGDTF